MMIKISKFYIKSIRISDFSFYFKLQYRLAPPLPLAWIKKQLWLLTLKFLNHSESLDSATKSGTLGCG
jgi:hypothetical protein